MAEPNARRPSPSAKRKLDDSDSDSDADVGPQLPSSTKQDAQDAPSKRTRTIGPAMPPPGMIPQADESNSNSSDDDDEDDDYGPSLPPPGGASQTSYSPTSTTTIPAEPSVNASSKPTGPSKRDDWMLRPPDELDLSSRVDPTKLRNRKFNTAPSRAGASGSTGPSKMWTETPEEKRRRLENEVMGIQAPAGAAAAGSGRPKVMSEEEVRRARMVQEYNDKRRNKSLYAQHKEGRKGEDEVDDPSARAFDKEKDIRAPSKITNAQRREMVNKASNFSSRFSGGNFL